MRTLFASLCIASLPFTGMAQRDHRIELDAGIDLITVYLNGGEVRMGKDVELVAGRNVLFVKGLSPHAYDQSVQASFKGASGLEILSVSTASNFLNAGNLEPRIDVLKDSVALLNERITDLDDRMSASEAEKEMLAQNHDIGGNGVVVSAEQLAKAADFFRDRTLLVNKTISKLRKEQEGLREKLGRTEQQLAELNYRHDPQRKEVTIVLNAEKSAKVQLDLRYLVANTGWAPIYDLVAKNSTDPVILRYKAQVYNNTGIPWTNVKLTLSTADPSLGASKPEMAPWYLGSVQKHYLVSGGSNRRFDDGDAAYDMKALEQKQLLANDATQKYGTVAVAEVSAEFPIARPYDIPNDAKPYLVDVAEHMIPATYSYTAVPKLDRSAFLLARVTGWEKFDLVDGKANVYYGDSYVGESAINTSITDDTLDLSLGRDNNLQLTRVMKEDLTSRKLIGNERKETMTFEITVKNNGAVPVTVSVKDQVPVSQDSEIKVDVLELSGGEHNETTGTIEWPSNLAPGASRTYTLSFAIRYPKNKQVEVRKLRVVACPRF